MTERTKGGEKRQEERSKKHGVIMKGAERKKGGEKGKEKR